METPKIQACRLARVRTRTSKNSKVVERGVQKSCNGGCRCCRQSVSATVSPASELTCVRDVAHVSVLEGGSVLGRRADVGPSIGPSMRSKSREFGRLRGECGRMGADSGRSPSSFGHVCPRSLTLPIVVVQSSRQAACACHIAGLCLRKKPCPKGRARKHRHIVAAH